MQNQTNVPRQGDTPVESGSRAGNLSTGELLEMYKFYEEAAEKTKALAWAQTTWILTLNAAILGFSVNFYTAKVNANTLATIEILSSGVGVVLALFLVYMLDQLGTHICNHWTVANKIAARFSPRPPFIKESEAQAARDDDYSVEFPKFCRRLQLLAGLFLLAHVGWAIFVLYLAPWF